MKVSFEASFARDLKRLKDKKLLGRVKQVIEETKAAADLSDIKNLRKMKSYATFYRIRLGDYRIGVEVLEDEIILEDLRLADLRFGDLRSTKSEILLAGEEE